MICEKCHKEEVEMTGPQKLCRGCWYDWYTEGWKEPERTEGRKLFIQTGCFPDDDEE